MSERFPWEKDKLYKTEGGLVAKITNIKSRAIPKNMSSSALEELMSKPHYGLTGLIYIPSNLQKGYRCEWTLGGVHAIYSQSSGVADLTEEEYTHESN